MACHSRHVMTSSCHDVIMSCASMPMPPFRLYLCLYFVCICACISSVSVPQRATHSPHAPTPQPFTNTHKMRAGIHQKLLPAHFCPHGHAGEDPSARVAVQAGVAFQSLAASNVGASCNHVANACVLAVILLPSHCLPRYLIACQAVLARLHAATPRLHAAIPRLPIMLIISSNCRAGNTNLVG